MLRRCGENLLGNRYKFIAKHKLKTGCFIMLNFIRVLGKN